MFNKCDVNGDGVLSKDEFFEIWRCIDDSIEESVLDAFFQMADEDGNGTVDFEEYMKVASKMEQELMANDDE